ncbi:cellulase [Mycena rebaudengoi]|nr:cellulase [Mycena rebaudengoi]
MFPTAALVSLCLLAIISAQNIGTQMAENHPTLTSQKCTASGCTNLNTAVVLDSNWLWNKTLCPDPATCAKNCALEIIRDYSPMGGNLGDTLSKFSFAEMPADGGVSTTNKAGAKCGTGYCDSQCANVNNWTTSPTDINSGTGKFGTCCNEMDIWEDKNAAAYTPHICTSNGLTQCTGTDCGDGDLRYDGICDKDGCDFNSYRMGDKTFLGPGLTVNTNQKFTIVTQFIANNNSISGMLTEIRRLYSGKVIQNSNSAIAGVTGSSIIDAFCNAQKTAFGDTNGFEDRGGLAAMGRALGRGMVLALSLWDDHTAGMYWLDSTYPTNGDASKPGILRGPCSTTSGDPKTVESQQGSSSVTYSNIRTTGGNPPGTPTTSSTGGSPTSPPGGTVGVWEQCGEYHGPIACVSGTTCTVLNPCESHNRPFLC